MAEALMSSLEVSRFERSAWKAPAIFLLSLDVRCESERSATEVVIMEFHPVAVEQFAHNLEIIIRHFFHEGNDC